MDINISGSSWDQTIRNLNGFLAVSSQLAKEIKQFRLYVGTQYPIAINKVTDGAIIKKEPLEYSYFRSRRALKIDRAWSEYPEGTIKRMSVPYRHVPVPATWLGDDLFGLIDEQQTSLYCSRRFVETAFQRQWPHFYFMAMDLPYGVGRPECRINPGKLKGPPNWYPEGFAPHPDNLGPMPVPDTLYLQEVPEKSDENQATAKLALEAGEKWELSTDEDEGEPTGFSLLGEPVRWQYEDPEWTSEERETVRGLIRPFLETALKTAEAYLHRLHGEAEVEEPLEVWKVGVALASEQPEDETQFQWEINIAAHHAGVCLNHFLTFQGSELIDTTAAD